MGKREPIDMEKIQMPVNRPFKHIAVNEWEFLSEWSPRHEYDELDNIYAIIDGSRENDTATNIQALRKDYEERFPKMFAQALENYARAILDGNVQFEIDF